jgi:predicted nucleotidyltransferase
MPPVEPTAARTFARLYAEEQARLQVKAEAALAMVARLGRVALDHGARRVWLFGSLVTGDWHSVDIDLAVEGVADVVRLGAELERAAHPFAVDVVAIEDAPDLLRQRIAEHGRLIAEREGTEVGK